VQLFKYNVKIEFYLSVFLLLLCDGKVMSMERETVTGKKHNGKSGYVTELSLSCRQQNNFANVASLMPFGRVTRDHHLEGVIEVDIPLLVVPARFKMPLHTLEHDVRGYVLAGGGSILVDDKDLGGRFLDPGVEYIIKAGNQHGYYAHDKGLIIAIERNIID
jgi:hypothetical protein